MKFVELISDPITLRAQDQQIFKHADLPVTKDELSVTLRLKLHCYNFPYATIFHKGTGDSICTPGFWLKEDKLLARFTSDCDDSAGTGALAPGLLLNKWYHLTYTLSNTKKSLDLYIDGQWTWHYSLQDVKTQNVKFNDGPLYIGRAFSYSGINGEISNFRYFDWCLSAEEAKEDFLKRPILNGSKIALVHVSTRKYLSTRSKYTDVHYMVICNGQKVDLENDVWTVIGASGTGKGTGNLGNLVYFNTIIGFKHQATGCNLHSHDMGSGATPKSKHQQVTLYKYANHDDDWLIRRYSQNASYDDSGSLNHGDIISLFHIRTGKPALYSHNILLDDATQEVSCHGNGNEENHKWRVELIV